MNHIIHKQFTLSLLTLSLTLFFSKSIIAQDDTDLKVFGTYNFPKDSLSNNVTDLQSTVYNGDLMVAYMSDNNKIIVQNRGKFLNKEYSDRQNVVVNTTELFSNQYEIRNLSSAFGFFSVDDTLMDTKNGLNIITLAFVNNKSTGATEYKLLAINIKYKPGGYTSQHDFYDLPSSLPPDQYAVSAQYAFNAYVLTFHSNASKKNYLCTYNIISQQYSPVEEIEPGTTSKNKINLIKNKKSTSDQVIIDYFSNVRGNNDLFQKGKIILNNTTNPITNYTHSIKHWTIATGTSNLFISSINKFNYWGNDDFSNICWFNTKYMVIASYMEDEEEILFFDTIPLSNNTINAYGIVPPLINAENPFYFDIVYLNSSTTTHIPIISKAGYLQYRYWTQQLYSDNTQFKDVIIPGSYNPQLSFSSLLINNLSRCSAVGQVGSITKQFYDGARYFEISTYPYSRKGTHRTIEFNYDLQNVLDTIIYLLKENEGEFFILNFDIKSPDYVNIVNDALSLRKNDLDKILYQPFHHLLLGIGDLMNVQMGDLRGKLVISSNYDHGIYQYRNSFAEDPGVYDVTPVDIDSNDNHNLWDQFTFLNNKFDQEISKLNLYPFNTPEDDEACFPFVPGFTCGIVEAFKKEYLYAILDAYGCIEEADVEVMFFEIFLEMLKEFNDHASDIDKLYRIPTSCLSKSSYISTQGLIKLYEYIQNHPSNTVMTPNIINTNLFSKEFTRAAITLYNNRNDKSGYNVVPSNLSLSVEHPNIDCNGAAADSAKVIIEGGFPPYKIRWHKSNHTGIKNAISIGHDSVTVIDSRMKKITLPFHIDINHLSIPSLVDVNTTLHNHLKHKESITFHKDCKLVAKVNGNNLNSGIRDSITATVRFMDDNTDEQFVKRHYEIIPHHNSKNSLGTVTLFFTQEEFNQYNKKNTNKLPFHSNDIKGKERLLVKLVKGKSLDNSGKYESYVGEEQDIYVDANSVIWDANNKRWSITFNTQGFGGYFLSSQDGDQDRTFINFSASSDGDNTNLIWNVSEENVRSYVVEYSVDNKNFYYINEINSKGNGNNNSYHYQHTPSMSNFKAPIYYYRIKMIGNDKLYKYSETKTINNALNILYLYPNPASDFITLQSLDNIDVKIVDMTGRIMNSIHLTQEPIKIDVSQYTEGIYMVTPSNGGKTLKFLKRK